MKESFDIWKSKFCDEHKIHNGLITNNPKIILENIINYGN